MQRLQAACNDALRILLIIELFVTTGVKIVCINLSDD